MLIQVFFFDLGASTVQEAPLVEFSSGKRSLEFAASVTRVGLAVKVRVVQESK